MTFEELMASPAEMKSMTDEELLAYFAPYIKFCRPPEEGAGGVGVKRPGPKPSGGGQTIKTGAYAGMKTGEKMLIDKILQAAKKQGNLGI